MESTSVVGTTSIYWRREYFAMFIERRGALFEVGPPLSAVLGAYWLVFYVP